MGTMGTYSNPKSPKDAISLVSMNIYRWEIEISSCCEMAVLYYHLYSKQSSALLMVQVEQNWGS